MSTPNIALSGGVADLNARAVRAMAAGDPASARPLLQKALDLSPEIPIWLNLAGCCRALGDLEAAHDAVAGALKADPLCFLALLMQASLYERQGRMHEAATAYGVALSQAPPDDRLDPATLKAVRHGRDVNSRYVSALSEFLASRVDGVQGGAATLEGRRINIFVDLLLGRRRNYRQEPSQFFYPGLPAVEFHERSRFPFLPELEAQTSAIQQELASLVIAEQGGFVPYIAYPDGVPLEQWTELNRSSRWSAYHLFEAGKRVEENCSRCPRTAEILSILPQPWVRNRSPASMFSALQPRTRIPPHTGITNTRLVLHVPLVTPPDCGFRVGGEVRQWRLGEAWVFDDTIEHEAWNGSDEVRVIMICDLWRPDLGDTERELIRLVMESLDDFSQTDPARFS